MLPLGNTLLVVDEMTNVRYICNISNQAAAILILETLVNGADNILKRIKVDGKARDANSVPNSEVHRGLLCCSD